MNNDKRRDLLFKARENHYMKRFLLMIICAVLITAAPVWAGDIRTERVQFEPGATSAVIEGSITGYETVDYVLRAGKGQYMNVSMATDNTASYFNILAPGEDQVAMFNGSISENQYEGTSPNSGDYKIRVYMMRSAARRNEVAKYRLEVVITGNKDQAGSWDYDEAASTAERRAGVGDFDATGRIPCAQYTGQPRGQLVARMER